MKRTIIVPLVLATVFVGACSKKEETPAAASASTTAAPPPPPPKYDKIQRADFNRIAAELALPMFWIADANDNKSLDPEELAVYWGLGSAVLGQYVAAKEVAAPPVADGAAPAPAAVDAGPAKLAFTDKFATDYESIFKRQREGATNPPGLDPKEIARRDAVLKELAQGRVTLVQTDFTGATKEEKRFVTFILKAAETIEKIYAKQQGVDGMAKDLSTLEAASQTLFFRGQGPRCEAPLTQGNPACTAIPSAPTGKLSGLYPAELLDKPKFCEELSRKDKTLVDPFTVVVKGEKDKLEAKKYSEVYASEMQAVSTQLKGAAEALGETEPALKAYLLAAAQAFTDDDWFTADEAWAKMDGKNSKFYLRIAPDEVYDEPCSTKALFHVSFGRINQASLAWQQKLDPLKGDMEKALADLAGGPYKAREVAFSLPDFVDIALNAGDSRKAFGATIGQSLPNFGPVANGGRGRTVAMTNFYTDPDSLKATQAAAESLFCKDTMAKFTTDPAPQLMSTVLHEAAHNLGPAHQYKVGGRIDRDQFGGPLASTLEELKAQSSALYFTDWLVEKEKITREEADKAHVRDVFWAFGHISRGMYSEDKRPKNYSHLAAIQVARLMEQGALAWKADEKAANDKDAGCFSVDLAKFPAAAKAIVTEVAQIKSKGDRARADKLVKELVDLASDKKGEKKAVRDAITERMLRAPKPSFVYSIKLD